MAKNGRPMSQFTKVSVTVGVWFLYALIIRPLALIAEIVCAALKLIIDIVFFPVDFMAKIDGKEGEANEEASQ